jgi:hypothetical protein
VPSSAHPRPPAPGFFRGGGVGPCCLARKVIGLPLSTVRLARSVRPCSYRCGVLRRCPTPPPIQTRRCTSLLWAFDRLVNAVEGLSGLCPTVAQPNSVTLPLCPSVGVSPSLLHARRRSVFPPPTPPRSPGVGGAARGEPPPWCGRRGMKRARSRTRTAPLVPRSNSSFKLPRSSDWHTHMLHSTCCNMFMPCCNNHLIRNRHRRRVTGGEVQRPGTARSWRLF